MNPTTRFLVVLACLVVAVLESPRAAAVLAEDVAGPYAACGVHATSIACTDEIDGTASAPALFMACPSIASIDTSAQEDLHAPNDRELAIRARILPR